MTTLVELNRLVRDSISSIVPVNEVIVANPNAPRPSGSFATVFTAEMTQKGIRDIEFSTNLNDLDEKVVRMFEARMSINFFRDNARLNAALFASGLAANDIVSAYNAEGVGVVRFSGIRDLTQVFNMTHEERAQLDLFLHFELTAPTKLVTGVDTIQITGDIDNSDSVLESVTINIP